MTRQILYILFAAPLFLSCNSNGENSTKGVLVKKTLTPELIMEKFVNYEIAELKKMKDEKSSDIFEDRKYIKDFWVRKEKDEDDTTATVIDFFITYANYPKKWKEENEFKFNKCLGSYTFQFDESKLNSDNEYTRSSILKTDLNDDGFFDYIIDGYNNDCSGGSGSEARYVLTFVGAENDFTITDLIYGLGEFKLNNKKMIFSGEYKALSDFKTVYDFNIKTNKWVENKKESYWNNK